MAKQERKRKMISIDIEFDRINDLPAVMFEIQKRISQGNTFERKQFGESIYQFSIDYNDPANFKEEIINGQWCQVYKSKL